MTETPSSAPRVPSSAVQRRLVVVGGACSGAPLVRALLGAYAGVHDLGESGLFSELLDRPRRRRPWTVVGLSIGHERRRLGELVERRAARAGGSSAAALPPREPRLAQALTDTVAALDRMALSAGCRSWLEHTPGTPSRIPVLESHIPRLRVVHVIRDGRDELAAYCARAAMQNQSRRRLVRVAQAVIDRWNRALAAHARCLGRPGHSFVLYEDLVRQPRRELLRLVREVGLEYHPEAVEELLRGVDTQPARAERVRFRALFDRDRRRRIEARLDLDRYGSLAERFRGDGSWGVAAGIIGG